jgi:hypothetical protein
MPSSGRAVSLQEAPGLVGTVDLEATAAVAEPLGG